MRQAALNIVRAILERLKFNRPFGYVFIPFFSPPLSSCSPPHSLCSPLLLTSYKGSQKNGCRQRCTNVCGSQCVASLPSLYATTSLRKNVFSFQWKLLLVSFCFTLLDPSCYFMIFYIYFFDLLLEMAPLVAPLLPSVWDTLVKMYGPNSFMMTDSKKGKFLSFTLSS